MKKIKYTPDAADKLRALKSAISGEYGEDKAKRIIKSITADRKKRLKRHQAHEKEQANPKRVHIMQGKNLRPKRKRAIIL